MEKSNLTFELNDGTELLSVDNCPSIPQKGDKVFIQDDIYKVKRSLHFFNADNCHYQTIVIVKPVYYAN